uniref:Uncharacterized protein n=1 Tax=Rhizophora mucronata TaxID=61149 RepID=A0A2P2MT20_RHIMU
MEKLLPIKYLKMLCRFRSQPNCCSS